MGLLRLFKKPNIEKLEQTKDVDGLIAALGDKDQDVRFGAAYVLGRIGSPAIEPLITALGDMNVDVRRRAAFALGEIGSPKSVPALKKATNDFDIYVRDRAEEALGKIGYDACEKYLEVASERKTEYDPAVKSISETEGIISEIRAEGVAVPDELLTNSKQEFEKGDYSASISLAKEQKNLIAVKKSHKETSTYISSIESEIAELKSSGVKMRETEGLLKQAKAELNENNFIRANQLANRAKKVASERKPEYDSAVKSISETEEILSEIRAEGVAVPDELLTNSKQEFDNGNYEEAIEYAKQSEDTAKKIQEESKPEISLNLPEGTFSPNQWKRINITIQNTGSMHAKKIKIEPSGEIEFRRIPTIPQLNTNKTETITIAMKPTVAGDVPIDITLTYKDALDRDCTSSEEVWVTVADSASEQAPLAKQSATIEIKRDYEVLSNNDLRFGIRVTNSTDYAIMDVKTILNYPRTLFSLKGSEIQTLSNIDPHGKRTATYKLTPRACIHNEKIDATIFYKDHTGSSQNVPMRPKEVHCVCPYLKEKPMREGEFAQLADASERIQEGLLFMGVGVGEIAGFVKESCAHRLYVIGEHEVDATKVVHLAGESLGEKAYYLLTAVIQPYEGITQVALRAYSDKPYGLHGFLSEMAGSLRHLVGSVQSAREIGVIEKKQVINIIDSVVQRTTFAGGVGDGTGAADVNIDGSIVQRSEIGSTQRCPDCGVEVRADDEFCTECGTRLR